MACIRELQCAVGVERGGNARGKVAARAAAELGVELREAGGPPCAFETQTIPTTEGAPSFALFAKGGLAGTSTGGCPVPHLWGPGNRGGNRGNRGT